MLFSLQLYKLLHLIGISMLFGGVLTSFFITRKYKGDAGADQGAFVASHLVAAPGLVLILFTGVAQSFLHQWIEFKGTGYMHAKILFVFLSTVLLAMDIRAQGKMRRSQANNAPFELPMMKSMLFTRSMAGSLNLISILIIFILIIFRPF
ncbi:DUF2269 family protein [Candidatus Dependentiae bacterium]|nr:DUF2269 family protein [Candidatus Dependentiae bacterium]